MFLFPNLSFSISQRQHQSQLKVVIIPFNTCFFTHLRSDLLLQLSDSNPKMCCLLFFSSSLSSSVHKESRVPICFLIYFYCILEAISNTWVIITNNWENKRAHFFPTKLLLPYLLSHCFGYMLSYLLSGCETHSRFRRALGRYRHISVR